jgi:phosphomethylpyrimidine synthase
MKKQKEAVLNKDEETIQGITRKPLSGSKKIYVPGKIHPIKVAMREISLEQTTIHSHGKTRTEENAPVTVYDTSGPYTDPNQQIDLKNGLQRLREDWIINRGDVQRLEQFILKCH